MCTCKYCRLFRVLFFFSFSSSAPSAGVQGLIGVNSSSTSLSISWQPPPIDDRNGVIRAYNISYGLTMQDRSDYVSESRTEMMTELRGLEKFTVYVVVVSAFTVADGPEEMVTVRTDSDCKQLYYPHKH